MSTRKFMVVLFNLKPGVRPADYEKWARETDVPNVRALGAVDSFDVFRAFGLLGSDAKPPYQYVELIEFRDLDKLGADASSATMQRVGAEFLTFSDNPIFMLTEQFT